MKFEFIENYINLWNGNLGVINQVYMVFWHFIAIPMLMYIASYPIRYQRGGGDARRAVNAQPNFDARACGPCQLRTPSH